MALDLKNIALRRGEFSISLPEMTLEKGKVYGLTGPSGSGKSTVFDALAGFLPLQAGQILLEGRRIDPLAPEDRRIALVFQKGTLFPHLNVLDNVAFPLRLQGIAKGERHRRAREWLERVQISELAERRSHEVSGGQAQRVAIARALATGFPILLLDEPLSGLNPELRQEIGDLIRHEVKTHALYCLWISHLGIDFDQQWRL